MAMEPPDETFVVRFMQFYDACSPDEQAFLSWAFSSDPGASAEAGESEVEGFGVSRVGGATPMTDMLASFGTQYLQLQDRMQHENRVDTAVLNITRTKHGAVGDTINSIH